MIWVQGVDVEFSADVFGSIGAQNIESEGSESGEVARLGSDAGLIFEEADLPDVVVAVFDAPMLTDGGAEGGRIQGDLAGIEGDLTGLLPKPGLGILVPGVTGDADGGLDQPLPVGSEALSDLEGFDETPLVSAMALLVDGQGGVERLVCGRDRLEGIEQDLLIGLDLGDQEIVGLTCRLKGFFDNAWRRR